MISEQIGRYQIKSELGRGGMATVYRAYDPECQREVALKVLPREFLHDPTFQARFKREAETIRRLKHPAIVPVYEVGEEEGQPYLVMCYLSGGTLTERLKKGPLALNDVAAILNRLTPALEEAHQKGIIHRDIKPDNILFDQHNQAYITDFGIVKLTEGTQTLTSGGVVIGTPAYLSPEQANGSKLDRRSDIYALGVLLFQMLAGRLPFQADTPIGLIMKHITEPIPNVLDMNPTLPSGCQTVIAKSLAKERDERYQTATDLTQAFSTVIDPDFISWPDMSIFDTSAGQIKLESVSDLVEPEEAGPDITCPKCQVVNGNQVRFCKYCGARLKVDCTLCHIENRVDATHCIRCGSQFKALQLARQKSNEARQQAILQRVQSAKEKEARHLRKILQSLFKDLQSRKKRTEALEQLNQLTQKAFDLLWDSLVSDEEPESRRQTITLLGQIAQRTDLKAPLRSYAVQILVDVMEDPNPHLRQQVQDILQRVGYHRPPESSDLFNSLLGWWKSS
jgi:serine/threonine-protein kinase